MDDPWQILRGAGLPLGSPAPGGVVATPETLAAAVHAALATAPVGRARDALSAFVLAWKRHWPRTFARCFDDTAPSVIAWADAAVTDADRYLKLSRIATAHLANVL